jgi:uncharacterized membrane protein YfcA
MTIAIVGVLIFAAALLYASVGQAGASGYLAAMAICGIEPAVMRPTDLVLNILVATIATAKFSRAGCFSWSLFWPLALPSIPAAFVGGAVALPGAVYRPVVGLTLLFAASGLLRTASRDEAPRGVVPIGPAVLAGAVIGLLGGLTGTGGGIFLTPLLVLLGWAEARRSAGVSAAFNLVNSAAGLAGVAARSPRLPGEIPYWAAAAVAGGLIGAEFGSRRLGSPTLRRLLAAVLVIAGSKLLVV